MCGEPVPSFYFQYQYGNNYHCPGRTGGTVVAVCLLHETTATATYYLTNT